MSARGRLCGLALLAAATAEGALPLPGGYYQNVPLWSRQNAFAPGGASDFNRFRLSSDLGFGPFSVEIAYEHVLTLRENDASGLFVGAVPGGGEWLDLQWSLEEREHVSWQHRFDRLKVGIRPTDRIEIDVGRQTVSWATTLFLTPADPFSPFDPADPFRVFRAGVDAARVHVYPSPLSEIDVVVRPTKTAVGEELTALGRGLFTWRGWELSGWGGLLYDDVAGSVAAAGSLGAWAVRGESVFRQLGDELRFRGTIGLDRRFTISGRDLFATFELQHDGLAAASAGDYPELFASQPYLRGELQVLGRDEAVVQASYQIHPLWSLSALGLGNVRDGSVLLSPSVSYSASDETTVTGGAFFGLGDDRRTEARPFPSEYGLAPFTLYASVSWFF